ncbi:hypothetical protein C8R45DRAFT_1021617 [Mycena sanguinolenta]|nr:hypothetical protein C8R45DRAFT_1021617 [Mycena sanguinolenta]
MRVCRRWKDIAFSTPRLWSSLCVESASRNKIMVRRGTFHGLETWFSRAGECPLSLIITSFNQREVKASNLEQLDLSSFLPCLCHLDASLPDADIKDIMKNAPLLAELRWSQQPSGNIDLRGFTSDTLTTLRIDSFSPFSAVEFITILQNFPALCDLTCNVKPDERPHTPPLTFPNLSSLCLSGRWNYAGLPIYVLELLTLPHLGALKCQSFLKSDAIIPFLARSACVIRELQCDFRRGCENIVRILGILPSLETLTTTVHDIRTCLAALEPDDGAKSSPRPILVPKLQYIAITCKREVQPHHCRRLIDIVNLRRARSDTAELNSVHIFGPRDTSASVARCAQCPGEGIIAEFRSLIEGGLDFKIHGTLEWSTI